MAHDLHEQAGRLSGLRTAKLSRRGVRFLPIACLLFLAGCWGIPADFVEVEITRIPPRARAVAIVGRTGDRLSVFRIYSFSEDGEPLLLHWSIDCGLVRGDTVSENVRWETAEQPGVAVLLRRGGWRVFLFELGDVTEETRSWPRKILDMTKARAPFTLPDETVFSLGLRIGTGTHPQWKRTNPMGISPDILGTEELKMDGIDRALSHAREASEKLAAGSMDDARDLVGDAMLVMESIWADAADGSPRQRQAVDDTYLEFQRYGRAADSGELEEERAALRRMIDDLKSIQSR